MTIAIKHNIRNSNTTDGYSSLSRSSDKNVHKNSHFYLIAVDLLQGVIIFPMIIGHAIIWWDPSFPLMWPDVGILYLFGLFAFMVFPCFLFFYGLNTTNSLLRRNEVDTRHNARVRLLKRTIIFLFLGLLHQLVCAMVLSPELLLNWFFTPNLFHIFSLSTIVILVIFEISWLLERQVSRILLIEITSLSLVFVIGVFLIFHDYSGSYFFGDPNTFELVPFLAHILLDEGACPIFPFLAFPLAGSLLASYLRLPTSTSKTVVLKRSSLVVAFSVLFIITGLSLLSIEDYLSTPVMKPVSSSFLFTVIGILTLVSTCLILFLDLQRDFSPQSLPKLLLPLMILSKISLTIFFVHNVLFLFDASLIPTLESLLLIAFLYTCFYIVVAAAWQKWKFVGSLEWIIWKLQRTSWMWWRKSGKSQELLRSIDIENEIDPAVRS